MKVIFLADSISEQREGIHYFGLQLIKQIVDTYPEHEYLAISTKADAVPNIQNQVIPIDNHLPFGFRIRQFTSIPNYINSQKPDVVIELAHFGPFMLHREIKRITVIHDLSPLNYPEYHTLGSYLAHKTLLRRILKKANDIIVNSESTKYSIVNYYTIFQKKIQVCYPKLEQADTPTDSPILNRPYFLAIGTIEPRKNYKLVLEAYEAYRGRGGEHQLVIIGKIGWKTKNILQQLDHHPFKEDITLTGYVKREVLVNYLYYCSAYISASHNEGFGLPVYEALQFQKILILSDIPIYKEIAGECAQFFKKDDADALCKCMLNYETDLKKSGYTSDFLFKRIPFRIKTLES